MDEISVDEESRACLLRYGVVNVRMNSSELALSAIQSDDALVVRRIKLLISLGLLNCENLDKIMVLTTSSRVTSVVALLRSSFPDLVVGSVTEHEWMLGVLDLFVAAPVDGVAWRKHLPIATSVVLDQDIPDLSFWNPSVDEDRVVTSFQQVSLHPKLASCMDEQLRAIIARELPEAASCPGLCDEAFCMGTESFSRLNESLGWEDWSGVVAFMPGLVFGTGSSLVLAPSDKVHRLIKLLQSFASYMGRSNLVIPCLDFVSTSPKVTVGTPEDILSLLKQSTTMDVKRVVIIQVDSLLPEYKPKIQSIFDMLGNDVQVGLHSLSSFADEYKFIGQDVQWYQKAEVSLYYTYQLYILADNEMDKMEKLCDVWKKLRRRAVIDKFSVMCDHAKSTAEFMVSRGFDVCVIDDSTPQHEVAGLEERFCMRGCTDVLVTSKPYRGSQDMISVGLPATPQEYVQRVGIDRWGRYRMVINIVTADEKARLEEIMENYGLKLESLPSNMEGLRSYCRKAFEF